MLSMVHGAMGGVIVVTTKKGKAGNNRISYTGEFTMRMRPSYSQFNIMNSQEQMGIYKEMALMAYSPFHARCVQPQVVSTVRCTRC